ncbi:ATP-binding protein [Pseudomonas citronellolis]|uniref:ATP-binding protein n=1 Tax=Pseudomonas citronellolis TaxID=53408 RepID=UPI00071888B1|nr:ATP-binding protein [Pseudomonas citronellolis]KRV66800.1 chemotaxis protein CheY [Pseudomonas citronellolis]KRW75941.1 chemotaxis protein CheY [Pseudomonas citronellolis]
MKLGQFLRPLDASFSTPSAARKLLRLLSGALLLCLLCSLAFALSMAFNHEVSIRRRDMNAAMYEAQLYFSQRESLLDYLGRGHVPLATPVTAATRLPAWPGEGPAPLLLPLPGAARALLLFPGDLAELRDKRLGLIHVASGATPQVSRLNEAGHPDAALPAGVLAALAGSSGAGPGTRWLADPGDPLGRLFLFKRLDDGWLGLEIRGDDLDAALQRPEAGDYLLLDRRHRVVFSSPAESPDGEVFRNLWNGDCFDFVGLGPIPQQVALLKHLGASNWALVYHQGVGQLLVALWLPILLASGLALAAGLLLQRLGQRIDQRLIRPAQQRLEALKESEAFSRAVIRAAPVALCVLRRADAAVVLENPQAEQWLDDGQVIPRDGARWIAQAFASDGGAACEELAVGGGRHLYLSYTPTRYNGEDVLFCAFSDISARKQAEAELSRAKQLADAANQAKTLFLATMSHEIRTPLYGVLGTLELLGRTRLDLQQTGYLQAIQRSSSTLLQLISDVLDVSKIEAGQLVLEPEEFSPLELTEEVVQSFAGAARAKGLQLFSCIDAQLPLRLSGDATRIRQILGNLLSNALKFTDSGRVLVRVRQRGEEGGKAILDWQVIDSGCGIAAEEQVRLFEPFYQVGGSARQVGGTGLGLSICKRLTRLMHGRLRVVSDLGLGSSFTLSLPLEPVEAAAPQPILEDGPVLVLSPMRELGEALCGWIARWGARARMATPQLLAEADDQSVLVEVRLHGPAAPPLEGWPGCRVVLSAEGHLQPARLGCDWLVGLHSLGALGRAIGLAQGCLSGGAQRERPAGAARDLQGLRVLVVEDNQINQLILRDQLNALGCRVELAGNGQEALQRGRAEDIDVVLTDLNMPRMDGYQLASELRQRGWQQPIIGATANAMREERERCLAAGMDDCLLKPVDLETLYRCLAAAKEIS